MYNTFEEHIGSNIKLFFPGLTISEKEKENVLDRDC